MKLTYASVCSGIEAASVAWKPLGWHCKFVSEIEPFPCAVLKHHYPKIPNYGDITKFKDWKHHELDIIVGGTPCQSFSVAGLREGLADPRGNLALVFLGIIDKFRPTWVCWENVPGIHSSWSDAADGCETEVSRRTGYEARRLAKEAGLDEDAAESLGEFEEVDQSNDFDCFLAALEKLGYGVATTILDAQFFGLAQRRERVFVVGHIGGLWQRAAAVLFDGTCLRWNPAPSRQTGETASHPIAPCVGASGRGFSNGGVAKNQLIAETLRAGGGSNSHGKHNVDGIIPIHDKATRHKGGGDTRDNDGSANGSGIGKPGDPCPTLDRNCRHAVAIPCGIDGGEISFAVRSSPSHSGDKGDGGMNTTLIIQHPEIVPQAISAKWSKGSSGPAGDEVANLTLGQGMAVRRYTPKEVERLQGFPDSYTDIVFRNKPATDGPRYKALGNSMAVPVMAWIGKRIEEVEAIK